jgi:uncharacterized protein YndB with AHSA1/START domain
MAADGDVVRVEREIAAAPDEVFDAWTDPESLRVWMAPEPLTVGAAECDPRVGGAFRFVMIDESAAIAHWGVYEEIERPHRLVFTWRADHLGDVVTRVRVDLTPTSTGTLMVIEHFDLPTPAQQGHRDGWSNISQRLSRALTPT